ncbi:MAG: hypothetical protein ACHQ50_14030 [Fimbriimonadales bacterium]
MFREEREESDCREGLSPEDRLRIIVEIWNEIQTNGYYGSADQVVVDEISREVTDAMSQHSPDVDRAESLTFFVLHLIAGNIDDSTTA